LKVQATFQLTKCPVQTPAMIFKNQEGKLMDCLIIVKIYQAWFKEKHITTTQMALD